LAKFDINTHFLVPKHSIMTDVEVKKLLETYSISLEDLPRIKKSDTGIAELKPKIGDVVKIERDSELGGKVFYYRLIE
jgi:DNA-directed RNA polymerase subunit H